MAKITLKGNEIETNGNLPEVGQIAPDFKLVKSDLSELTLSELKGKKVIFNIFPSVDTPVCATQIKSFSQKAADKENTVLVFASQDLPFAAKRFCAAEGIENAVTASDFKHNSLDSYGVKITTGPLQGLCARAVLVIDEEQKVTYSELVPEIAQEPNYDAALAAL